MIPLATRWAEGVAGVIADAGLAWNVQRLGCRAEYWFCPPPRNGAEAAAAVDEELDAFMHLWAMNRGILLTPFHNMALLSPFHTETAVDRHTEVFAAPSRSSIESAHRTSVATFGRRLGGRLQVSRSIRQRQATSERSISSIVRQPLSAIVLMTPSSSIASTWSTPRSPAAPSAYR